jgi:hypothetical protein
MIRLAKKDKPQVLIDNATTWTQVLLNRATKNEKPTDAERNRYRHPEIKAVLIEETSGKCAYCESKVRHITYGDVEHIVPKSTAVEKTFEWENLTLACDVCNGNKSNDFGNHESFVDPYKVEPSEHFFFAGPMILPLPTSDPGLLTESVLKLNRVPLVEKRIEKIESLNALVRNFAKTQDTNLREVLRKDLEINETAATREYAGLARQFIKDVMSRVPPCPV